MVPKKDVIAGFGVFLLALPLCLGIAMASNFPPAAGILSAIVGGIIASFFGGAQLSIKGPAAGLIVIALSAVIELGGGDLQLGYERTLAVGVIAAFIQILIGSMRKAIIAEIIPPAVIHGMLAAIGVIIISKQSYVMLGLSPAMSEPFELIRHFPGEMLHLNPVIFAIGLISLAIAMLWPLMKKIAVIPSTIIILLVVIPLSIYFNLSTHHAYSLFGNVYPLGPNLLINLPTNFLSVIHFPDFSVLFSPMSCKYIIMFALVGSIESLLTVCAVDIMSDKVPRSNLNKDLCAVGVGNLVSSLIGGLPMISEIVRSKANIDYGATSVRANFFHGLFMLLAVLFFSQIMNLIPLSALAALLVCVGFKLASPKEFVHVYRMGYDQFFIFVTTFLVTLATDLLLGVSAGVLLKLLITVARGNRLVDLFKLNIITKRDKGSAVIQIEGPLVFVNYLKLKKIITQLTKEANHIIINLNKVTYLDYTVTKKFETLTNEFKHIKMSICYKEYPQR